MEPAIARPIAVPRPGPRVFAPAHPEVLHVRARDDVRARRTIAHAGDPADAVFRIERGLVKLVAPTVTGQERIVAVLGVGDTLGAFEVLTGSPHVVDIVALTDGSLSVMDAEAFRRHLTHDRQAALALVDELGRCRHAAWEDLTNAYLPVRTRLADALVRLAKRFSEPALHGRRVLRCGLNHHGFAALVGAQRGSVTAAMKGFREAGVAVGARGTYVIDVAGLGAYSTVRAVCNR